MASSSRASHRVVRCRRRTGFCIATGRRIVALALSVAAVSSATRRPAGAQEAPPAPAPAIATTAGAIPSPDTLVQPPTLRNLSHVPGVVEVELTAARARLRIVLGAKPADVYAYNGSVPGPTLELHEGDSVIIHFRNELPEPTTVHWHGLHLPVDADGSPFVPIAPGASHVYTFRVAKGTAGTYWYHPHPDRRTTYQVAMGLYGAIIVHDTTDSLAARNIPERLLILSDNRFTPDGAVAFPAPGSTQEEIDEENGREGNVLLVNGQVMPSVTIRSGSVERWRIVNASAARVYRLALAGDSLIHIGSDGGLFEHPARVADILIANSGRAEVLVRGSGMPGSATALEMLPYDRYMPQTRPTDWDSTRSLLTLRYSAQTPLAPVRIPATLRRVPPIDTAHVAAHRVIVLSQGLIDGRQMDMHRVDIHARLGTTEIWEIQNVVGMDHPFHLHGFRFQVLDRDGVPVTSPRWKDTVNVPKHSSVRIAIHFADFPGKWMYHCHILNHEDAGMMGVVQVN